MRSLHANQDVGKAPGHLMFSVLICSKDFVQGESAEEFSLSLGKEKCARRKKGTS